MKVTTKIIISVAAVLVILGLTFFGGYRFYHKIHPCAPAVSDTIIVHDTTTYIIHDTIPYYVSILDTIYVPKEIPQNVDTAKILKNYFSTYVYDRSWTAKDTLEVTIKDYISQNKSINNEFKYKILLPQTTIINNVDNSVHYTKYLYGGLNVPFKDLKTMEIEALYAFRKGYFGVGYSPINSGFSVKAGFTIFKFK